MATPVTGPEARRRLDSRGISGAPADAGDTGPTSVDLLVIGGGINGTGIARDAAGRGLDVLLCETDDLGAHTSSASTKLIHGGLRYLEQREFRLVRHSLQEREVLLRNAPHIIWPLRFVLPHHAGLRPWWTIRLGLFVYDHLGGRELLPPCASVDLARHASGRGLKRGYRRAVEYSDCWVQDSRLVVLNARDARVRGAEVRTRTECVSLARRASRWEATLVDRVTGSRSAVSARGVVNASGPWVGKTLDLETGAEASHHVRLVKGSHIVVRKLFDHPFPYIFQSGDGRVLFAIPFEEDYTLLGTTDVEIEADPGPVSITPEEVGYICATANEYFETPISPDDVVWSYSGIRPLFDDHAENASEVTRDYVLHVRRGPAPLLSVYGGKITTCRRLAEQAVDLLAEPLAFDARAWTRDAPLPGGDIPGADIGGFTQRCTARYPWLPERLLRHYVRHYGTDIHTLLAGCASIDDLGEHFGAGLHAAEVDFLVEHEWARTPDDILWRRTKKGLTMPSDGKHRLRNFLEAAAIPADGPYPADSFEASIRADEE